MSDNVFSSLLRDMRGDMDQKAVAKRLGITPQYLCDLEKGRRLASVAVVDRVCKYMGSSKKERKIWHLAGARSHGWDVS